MPKQKSAERKLAEQIAAQKGIKVKSAMRYIQRSAAPEGKQQIKKPKFAGLKKNTAKRAKKAVKQKKAAAAPAPAPVEKPTPKPKVEITNPIYGQGGFESGETVIIAVTATFYVSKDIETRRIRLYCTAAEANKICREPDFDKAVNLWKNTKDGQFIDSIGEASDIDFD